MWALVSILIVLLFISLFINLILSLVFLKRKKENGETTLMIENGEKKNEAPLLVEKKLEEEKGKAAAETAAAVATGGDVAVAAAAADAAKKQLSREEVFRSELEIEKTAASPVKAAAKLNRSERQKLLEPIGKNEFARDMVLIAEFVNEYFDDSQKYSVFPESEVNSEKIRKTIPENSENCSKILEDLRETIIKGICHTQHPRYHAKFSGRSLANVLSSTISSAIGFDLHFSPIIDVIERTLCSWLSTAIGLNMLRLKCPVEIRKQPIGTVVYNTIDAYLTVIHHCLIKAEPKTANRKNKVFVVYCSDDANCDIGNACEILNVKLRKVITKKENCYGMTGNCLKKQMEKDVDRKLVPILIVASYGSQNIAANDDVKELITVAQKFNCWIHVDANYGGCGWMIETQRDQTQKCLNDVNSLHICFSTMLPFAENLSIIWSSEKMQLPPSLTGKLTDDNKSLDFWCLIRMYGLKSLRESIKKKIQLGNMFSDRLTHYAEFFNVLNFNNHGVTLFQYVNNTGRNPKIDANKLTSMFYHFVNSSAQMKFGLIKFQGSVIIRSCINYERCNASQMEESVSTLINLVEDFEESMKKKKNGLKEANWMEFAQKVVGSPNETTDRTPPSPPSTISKS